jgi:hypothetical protein
MCTQLATCLSVRLGYLSIWVCHVGLGMRRWPHWAFNSGEFYLQSVVPLYRMQQDGIFGRNVKFMPVLDGLTAPAYFQNLLALMTRHKVHPLPSLNPSDPLLRSSETDVDVLNFSEGHAGGESGKDCAGC